MTKIKNYLALIRVHQWFKNILILLPVITTQKNIGSETYINLIIIFISFSLASSLVYVFNDFFDKNEDIKHPLKKTKPIANKSINLNEVIIIFIIIFLLFLFIITQFGMKSENTYLIKVEQKNENNSNLIPEIKETLINNLNADIDFRRVENVGPKVSSELLQSGIIAIS